MGLYATDLVPAPDTRANQPAANSVPTGALYCVSDEGNIVERSNGTTWDSYSPAAGGGGTVTPGTFEARLTGTTGVPVTTSDVTAIGTLYLTPFKGELIALYDGADWAYFTLTEISLALTGLIKGVCYDIFVYDSSGLTLEAVAWKKVTATNNPTAGSSKQIDVADTATLVVGMDVTVRDGSNSEIARITTVNASTSIVVDTLANSYTTPDVYGYRARTTALATQDGVYVKTGATERRYCGTICITATTAQTEDSAANRFIWNYYNRVPRSVKVVDTTTSWSYSTAAFRQANASKANQIVAVCGVLEDAVTVQVTGASQTSGATPRTRVVGVGLNQTTARSDQVSVHYHAANPSAAASFAIYSAPPSAIGRNYFAWLEYGAGADTQTWYGQAIASVIQCGITGTVMA